MAVATSSKEEPLTHRSARPGIAAHIPGSGFDGVVYSGFDGSSRTERRIRSEDNVFGDNDADAKDHAGERPPPRNIARSHFFTLLHSRDKRFHLTEYEQDRLLPQTAFIVQGTHCVYTVQETLLCCPGTQKRPQKGGDNGDRQDAPVPTCAYTL